MSRTVANNSQLQFLPMQSGSAACRPVHYLGSKLRLTSQIEVLVDKLNPSKGLVCDLFSGSGVVSSVLGQTQPVVAVDIQEYARVLGSALLRPSAISADSLRRLTAPPDDDMLGKTLLDAWRPMIVAEHEAILSAAAGQPEPLTILLESLPLVASQVDGEQGVAEPLRPGFSLVLNALREAGLDQSAKSMISRYFGGLFFGIEQAIHLDVLANRASHASPIEADTVMAALLGVASSVAGTVGKQFAQPLRPRDTHGTPKVGLWKRVSRDRSADVTQSFRETLSCLASRRPARDSSLAVRADYRAFLSSWDKPISVVYADPPYTRDHYSRYYHVLETICLQDQPQLSRSNLDGRHWISRGVYREQRHQSPFSIRSQAPTAFMDLFRLTRERDASLILSYSPHLTSGASRPRVMELAAIDAMAREFYGKVERVDVMGITHSKLTRTEMHLSAPETAEVLLVCTP